MMDFSVGPYVCMCVLVCGDVQGFKDGHEFRVSDNVSSRYAECSKVCMDRQEESWECMSK